MSAKPNGMIPLDRLSKAALIRRLRDAYVRCADCGDRFGSYRVVFSSWWEEQCQVCGEWKAVTETRDFGYLSPGITRLLNHDVLP